MIYMIYNLYTASSQSSTSSNSTHTGAAASTSAGNNNGCPSFPTHCDPNCLALDGMGCPICSCPKSKKRNFVPRNIITTKPSLFYIYIYWFGVVSYTALRNHVVSLFCLKAPQSAGSQTLTSSGATASPSQVNGCVPFPRNCSAECARIDSMGCIVCSCPSGIL